MSEDIAGEVPATVETLREGGDAAIAGSGAVSVKGVSAPMEVATVAWS
jgi:hypothetical protein